MKNQELQPSEISKKQWSIPIENAFYMLDSLIDAVAILDKDTNIIHVNDKWKQFSKNNSGKDVETGVDANYANNCNYASGEDEKTAQEAMDGIKAVVNRSLDLFELEYPCHSPTEQRWFILRVTPLKFGEGLTLVSHINITKRKLAELSVSKNLNKLNIVNNRLQSTIYKVVHDIQNPVLSIQSLVEISKKTKDDSKFRDVLRMIEFSAAKLGGFVTETLKYVADPDTIKAIDVNKILKDYKISILPLLEQKEIDLELIVDQQAEFVSNPSEFKSIVSNLIGNAIKYCDDNKEKKEIKVTFTSSRNAVLVVADNGIGIKVEDITNLQKRNYQVNKKDSSGVGLGLSMVKESLELIGGSLKIKSKLGRGWVYKEFCV